MPLIENGRIVEDRFRRLADDEAVPAEGAVLLPAERFLKEAEALKGRAAPVGVLWPNNRRIEEIAPHLPALALVALHFPIFRDGRAYSQARLLRERLGWRGPLRATGNVLRDQFVFMLRAGFDQLEPSKATDAAAFAEEVGSHSVFYQPTGDGRPSILRARLGRVAPAGAAG
ncbi:DUF934 domain-containing protein [Ancylobacter lacus]|uniref:DUF934 domain-containing protein n=1 Tax=Ancylobacter lacus TaxID=2579970 RepID=UPI001BCDA47A|nr:DUF934 domain-containing protein [Ancylobacter lacus]MBS7537869.1 DUF934 domain-containing protein [Ancylobacter lacus]